MTTKEQANDAALRLARLRPTSFLVESFALTDALMEAGLKESDYMTVAQTRGWIIQVLEERGELQLVDSGLST